MRLVLLAAMILAVAGCKDATPLPTEFHAGQMVHAKIGGPKGVVISSRRYIDTDREYVNVRFYRETAGVQVAVGGNGIVSGGNATTGGNPYFEQDFYSFELAADTR